MENKQFDIKISNTDGTISSLACKKDCHNMNWCSGIVGWGSVIFADYIPKISNPDQIQSVGGMKLLPAVRNTADSNGYVSVYENGDIRVIVERTFDQDGYLNEKYILKNLRDIDLFLEEGDVGIALPFNDMYTYADDCMTNRCNTHIWCGGNTTYINAVKMGESEINLGLVLTEGAIESYSMCNADTYNRRGVFILNCGHIELLASEEYVWNWKLFWHKDIAEFKKIIRRYKNTVEIEAENYTIYYGEALRCRISTSFEPKMLSVTLNESVLTPFREKDGYYIEYVPERYGNNRLTVQADDIHSYAEFYVSETPDELIKKRLYFIAEKQQYKRKQSPLYGAFLIYDNRKKISYI